jgi:hypothetical protein
MASGKSQYPPSVLTKNRKGETEVRNLLGRGEFVKYNYTDPKTGKPLEGGKFSIILKDSRTGKEEHYFLIPVKGGFLAIPRQENGGRMVWDAGRKKAAGA